MRGLIELQWIEVWKNKGDSPGPCLLGLEQDGDGWVVETREEGKIDNIPDVFIHTHSKIEDETGGIRYIPTRNEFNDDIRNASNTPCSIILFHDVEIRLRLIERQYSEGILWKR